MSTVTEIREAIAEQLEAPEWRVYRYVDESMELPAVVVRPKSGRVMTNARGVHQLEFELVALTPTTTARTGQQMLDELVGDVYASFPNGPLGDLDDTTVFFAGWDQDRTISLGGTDVNAAVFDVTVTTGALV